MLDVKDNIIFKELARVLIKLRFSQKAIYFALSGWRAKIKALRKVISNVLKVCNSNPFDIAQFWKIRKSILNSSFGFNRYYHKTFSSIRKFQELCLKNNPGDEVKPRHWSQRNLFSFVKFWSSGGHFLAFLSIAGDAPSPGAGAPSVWASCRRTPSPRSLPPRPQRAGCKHSPPFPTMRHAPPPPSKGRSPNAASPPPPCAKTFNA